MIRRRARLAPARLALVACVAACGLAAIAAAPQTTLNDVEDEVMCVVCGVPLNIAESPQADRERALIRRLVAKGETKSEVKQELVAQYGDAVLSSPSDTGFKVTSWIVPVAVFLALVAGAAVLLPRWRRNPPEATAGAGAPELDPDDARRLDEDLARYR